MVLKVKEKIQYYINGHENLSVSQIYLTEVFII